GQAIYAFVTLVAGEQPRDALRDELARQVRSDIGPIAVPEHIQWAPALPKTRSGKIMRRILRRIAEAGPADLARSNWATPAPWPIPRWWSHWCASGTSAEAWGRRRVSTALAAPDGRPGPGPFRHSPARTLKRSTVPEQRRGDTRRFAAEGTSHGAVGRS